MSRITVDDNLVRKVADLAQLSLTSDEVSLYQGRLARILDFVEQMNQAPDYHSEDCGGDSPAVPDDVSTPERPDQRKPLDIIDQVLAQAPARSGTNFQVPRIIE